MHAITCPPYLFACTDLAPQADLWSLNETGDVAFVRRANEDFVLKAEKNVEWDLWATNRETVHLPFLSRSHS